MVVASLEDGHSTLPPIQSMIGISSYLSAWNSGHAEGKVRELTILAQE